MPSKNPQFTKRFNEAIQAVLDGMSHPVAQHFIAAQYSARLAMNAAQGNAEKDAAQSLSDLIGHVASVYGLSVR